MTLPGQQPTDAAAPTFSPTASSGDEGLDQLLGGGFLRDDMHLVQGASGTGKTTLALQFLRAGVQDGEPGLFITLSQTRKRLEQIARSHGWSLDGMAVHEMSPTDLAGPPASQTVLRTADVELGEVVGGIREAVERVGPRRAVFDSLGILSQLAGNSHRYRSKILVLRQLLTDRGCTVLFLGDRPAEVEPMGHAPESEFHGLAGSVVHLDQSPPDYGEIRRRVRVIKVRGMPNHGGYHNFRIRTGGLVVFPRLNGYDKPEYRDFEPIRSGIEELDTLLGGGLERGTACLLIGPSGAGKSTLGSVFARAVVRLGEPAAIFLFDERPETYLARSAGVGVDIRPDVDAGRIRIRQLDTANISPGEFSQEVRLAAEKGGARVVILDSLTGYTNAMPGDRMLSEQMHDLLNYLSRQGTLTILTITQEGFASIGEQRVVDISYLSDTIVVLKQFEAGGRVRRCLVAIKKRQGEHETTIRELIIKPGSVTLGEPLDRFRGLLSGQVEPIGGDHE